MTPEQDNPTDRMESLLRLWGAARAADLQDLPPAPPVLKPVRLDLRFALICAGCILAGAAVAVAAMLLARRDVNAKPSPPMAAVRQTVTLPPPTETRPAEEEMHIQLPPSPSPEKNPPPVVIPVPETTGPSVEQVRRQLAQMRRRRDEAASRFQRAEAKHKALTAKIDGLQTELTRAKQTKEAMERLRADVEILRKEQEATLAKVQRLRKQITLDQQQHQARFEQMLDVYLSALAPEQEGLAAIQSALRTSRLLQRCHDLRLQADDDETRAILDRVEAVLLRLDFLNADDVSAMVRFETQLRRGDLTGRIASRLTRTDEPRRLRIFLAEVDLILSGVRRVG
ncbi:MAG: hypothetical protein JXA11_06515 [Phycisphaerae bacterium]|nr:hypothetical protein [Phycisphaerae bacterium]